MGLSPDPETTDDGAEETSLPPVVHIGDVIAGKYRVDQIRGAGGMGVVVEARHLDLDLPVAIKFMSPSLRDNPSGTMRFALEARATARMRCEHVVRVFDVAALPDGTPYIVMEYLEGEDLAGVLRRRGRLPVAEAVGYIMQACAGIAAAHEIGIVHRDLKPGNLFCCDRPHASPLVKVLDFGVSKVLPGADARLRMGRATGPRVVIGSPVYSSPEQLYGAGDVDGRADVWALGAVLFELLAGAPPFAAETVIEVCSKVVSAPLEPLAPRFPEVPAELDAVIARSLTKNREKRIGTVTELAEALAPFGPRPIPLTVATVPPPPSRAPIEDGFLRGRRFRAARWGLASVAVVGALTTWLMDPPRIASPEMQGVGTPSAASVSAPSFTRPGDVAVPETADDGDASPPPAPTTATLGPRAGAARMVLPPPPPEALLRPKKPPARLAAAR